MGDLSNLPPGVTDRMIEDQANGPDPKETAWAIVEAYGDHIGSRGKVVEGHWLIERIAEAIREDRGE